MTTTMTIQSGKAFDGGGICNDGGNLLIESASKIRYNNATDSNYGYGGGILTCGLNPNYAEAWYNKGADLNEQGKYDEAIKVLDEAIRLNPKLADAWYNKGNALKALGRTSEANAAFAKARELGYSG